QEVEGAHLPDPVEVVHHRHAVLALEVEEAGDLVPQALHPGGDDLGVVEDPLAGHPRIADEAGGATDQRIRMMARQLEPAHGEHLRQVSHVEGGAGGVETAIQAEDRKSTRLNSSHVSISYAV